jgi:general secretion pathway protein H
MRVRGYTLIEIVVVVAIVAIVAGAAMLSLGAFGGSRVVEREGNRFRELVRATCDRALASGHDYGIHLGTGGYAFSVARYQQWDPQTKDELRPREFPAGFSLSASREGKPLELVSDPPLEPQLVCYASGELTPFEARIELDPHTAYVVAGEIDAHLEGHAAQDKAR